MTEPRSFIVAIDSSRRRRLYNMRRILQRGPAAREEYRRASRGGNLSSSPRTIGYRYFAPVCRRCFPPVRINAVLHGIAYSTVRQQVSASANKKRFCAVDLRPRADDRQQYNGVYIGAIAEV